jgi:hypothetical protein
MPATVRHPLTSRGSAAAPANLQPGREGGGQTRECVLSQAAPKPNRKHKVTRTGWPSALVCGFATNLPPLPVPAASTILVICALLNPAPAPTSKQALLAEHRAEQAERAEVERQGHELIKGLNDAQAAALARHTERAVRFVSKGPSVVVVGAGAPMF